MTTDQPAGDMTIEQVRAQAARYFTAVHGPDWVYTAPETSPYLLERWMRAVIAGDTEAADELMTQVEQSAADQQARGGPHSGPGA